ncbi:MAG: phosphatidate cytidylyltransferase [Flavobacteriaceae bacterium]
MKELMLRSFSGLLYVALIVSSALHSDLSFILVIFIFSSLALYEFQKLINYRSPVPFLLFGLIVYQFYNLKLHPNLHLSLLGLSIATNLLLTYLLFAHKNITLQPLQKTAVTLFYMVSSAYFIIATSSLESTIANGVSISMYLLIWVNNSFAYLFGKRWGKTPLFIKISPKKSWEGFLGGAAMCLLISFTLIPYHPNYPSWTFPFLAIVIALAATVGDLVQSKFKRQAAVKDSGSLIPGHGGFYDRMDSVIYTAPFIFLLLMLIRYVS